MSDDNNILVDSLGTPLVWILDSEDKVIIDIDGRPVSRFFESFNYVYDEENDDEAIIKFSFPSLLHLNVKHFKQDVVLKLQWGYLLPNKGVLKSPVRLVAIRDKKKTYDKNGFQLTLQCTDLISYTKNVKINTVKKKDYFVDWLKEVAEGKFKATVTTQGFRTVLEKNGTVKDFNFDERENLVTQNAVDNARFETHQRKLTFNKIIKGKSKALNNAIDDLMKDVEGGPYIQDSTDNVLDIKTRNFNQKIFKRFTFAGTTGELLKFKSSTDTRRVKEDKNFSSKINPLNKKISDNEVSSADTKFSLIFKSNEFQKNALNEEPPQREIDHWIEKARAIYQFNIENPTQQKSLPDLTWRGVVYRVDSYMGQRTLREVPRTYTMSATEVLNNPDLEDEIANNRLTNYVVSKLQKKYKAEATVIGDPSLIKGKVYYFSNLDTEDIGKWYSVKVEHIIDESGYKTIMHLIKVPSPIKINKNKSIKTIEGEIQTNEVETDDIIIYGNGSVNENANQTVTPRQQIIEKDLQKTLDSISDRLFRIEAENDFRESDDDFQIDDDFDDDFRNLDKINVEDV